MGSSALMSIGMKTMVASYSLLQTTGHNIANANVEGYSRQRVELATAQGQFTGAGFFGKGVDVTTVARLHDALIAREAVAANSTARMDETRLNQLKLLETVFRHGEQGIGHAAGQMLNAMVDLASRPADAASRQVVLARAAELANRFVHAAKEFDTLQRGVSHELQSSVAEINQLAANIADTNARITAVAGLGQPPNDLLDERDRLIGRLSALIQVTTIAAEDGSMSVFAAGGQYLVLATRAEELRAVPDQTDPARTGIAIVEGGTERQLDDRLITGGSVAGLLRFQNHDLREAGALIGRLAAAVAGAVNRQQQLGVNLYQPFNTVPAEPFFRVGDPRAVPAQSNQRDPNGLFVSSVALTINDPAALQASEYRFRRDPGGVPGLFELTRLSDGLVRTVVSGDQVDGFTIDVGVPEPALTDSFRLQPVSGAAAGMRLLLDDVRDIAAASALVATAVPAATGTVGVDALRMLSPPPFPADRIRITFTTDTGDYTWERIDAGTNNVLDSGNGVWQAGGPIPAPPVDLNGFELTLLGVPRTGDLIRIDPADANNFSQNNGNALALAELRDAAIVGGTTVTEAYAGAIANVGVRVQGAKSTAQISGAMAEQAERARSAVSGVNLDEEAARLIQYQQSYQAAAKVLQVAQTVFDLLLETAGR